MILTNEMLKAAASNNCGFNKTQLQLLGVSWPPVKGWLRNLEGTYLDDAKWHQVMALSGVKPTTKRKEILGGQKNLF